MLDRLQGANEMENDPTADRNREPSGPDNNMNIDDDNNENEEMMEGEEFDEGEFDEEFGPQEFSALNNQLDQLQSALDSLESRNDDIHSKLMELLRSSREIRQVMTEENNQNRAAMVVEEEVGKGDVNIASGSTSNGSSSDAEAKNCVPLPAPTPPTENGANERRNNESGP